MTKAAKSSTTTGPKKHRENPLERFAEEVEARFLEGAEMATETTSAETNLALAALTAIEGPRDVGKQTKAKRDGKPKAASARRKKR